MSDCPDSDYEARLARYEALVATHPGIERKGAKMPYTSLNGHMFSFLDAEGVLSLRLPEPGREAFLVEHDARLSEQHGRVMKEYVVVPDAAFAASVAHLRTLKPKPPKRKATKKKKG